MSLPVSQHVELRKFLQTDDNRYLSWLHDIHTDNFEDVSHKPVIIPPSHTRIFKNEQLEVIRKYSYLTHQHL